MRPSSHLVPVVLAGFVAVLVGYASSAAIIWQAAAAAGASAQQIAGWMTALGIGMGVSTLVLSWWYKAPVLTAWSTPGAALLATSLHGVTLAASPLIIVTGGLALLFSPFGVFSICIAAITAAICQSPDAHPNADKRWLAAIAAGGFYLLAGIFGGSITGIMAALPLSWIQTLAGLALLGTISGSLYQALSHEAERDAAIVTFLTTASGVTILGIGSALWGLVLGGVCYALFSRARSA